MRLDDGARDRQPEAHPALLGTEERVEELAHVLRRDALAAVAHRDGDALACRRDRHHDRAPRVGQIGHRIHRVQHEVDEHLLDLRLVADDPIRRAAGPAFERDAPAPRFGTEERRHVARGDVNVEPGRVVVVGLGSATQQDPLRHHVAFGGDRADPKGPPPHACSGYGMGMGCDAGRCCSGAGCRVMRFTGSPTVVALAV